MTEAFHAGSEQHNDQQPAAAIEGHGEPGIGHSVDIIAGAAQLHAVGSGTGGSGGQLGGRRADHGKAHPGKRAADNGDHADGADEAGQGRADGSDHAALEALGAISFGKADQRGVFVAQLGESDSLNHDDGDAGTRAQPYRPAIGDL